VTVLTGSSSAVIDAGIEACWAVVADVARTAEWQQGFEHLEVVQRDQLGRPLICDTVNDAKITKVHCRVRMTYDPPQRLAWTRVQSDDVDAMEGSWELDELGDGRTRATYRLSVDPGPVGFLARPLERALRPLVVGRRAEELARAVAARRPG
jgi:Polyketide cyclase / dehydrase and lipid transport